MKTIGLLGGMSWESTLPYYRHVNETVKTRLGGLHSARLLLYSVDFHDIAELQRSGDWNRAGELLADAAGRLQRAGADFIVLCTNTMHKVAPAIEAAISIPLLHIVEPTAAAIRAAGFRRIGFIGTRFTMEHDFYRGRLCERHGIEALIPDAAERDDVHRIIYEELCVGAIRADSRTRYREVMANLVARGAEAIVLGCTEITLLVDASDSTVPQFDTTRLHAVHAAEYAIAS
jgi:aspartate racemase